MWTGNAVEAKARRELSRHSESFYSLMRRIQSTHSRREESRVIAEEAATLHDTMRQPDLTDRAMAELVIRLFVCEMLAEDPLMQAQVKALSHAHAIRLTASSDVYCKRIGYLATALCVGRSSDLSLLIVGSIGRDLRSKGTRVIWAGLGACQTLLEVSQIPSMLPIVISLAEVDSDVVIRKKAVHTLHSFYIYSKIDNHVEPLVRKLFADLSCLEVVYATILFVRDVVAGCLPKDRLRRYQWLCDILCVALRFAQPWMSIAALQTLSMIGPGVGSSLLEDRFFVQLLSQRQRTTGYAIQYEAIRTLSSITDPEEHPILLEQASVVTKAMLSSANPNLKYVGRRCLFALIRSAWVPFTMALNVLCEVWNHHEADTETRTVALTYEIFLDGVLPYLLGHTLLSLVEVSVAVGIGDEISLSNGRPPLANLFS